MKLFILLGNNPFSQSSASANRWLTLIEGLSKLDVRVELLIYGGYQSKKEEAEWKQEDNKHGVNYKYVAPKLIQGYWNRRFHKYISAGLQEARLIKQIFKELKNKEGVVWTDSNHFGFKLAVQLKKQQPDRRLFLEMSEFLDNRKHNKGNVLQRWTAYKRQKFFEKKAFHVYDGLALMTRTLYRHYQDFPDPKPRLLHLPMTVDLERFDKEIEPVKDFTPPYIAFVGVMNDAKDGVNILIQAFSKIHTKFPANKIYLIGPWNYDTPSHKKMITELGLERKVFWKGEHQRNIIPAILKNAELLVLPRPDSKQAQGGFPTKLGEYLATGNPVCATTVGEIPDYLVDGESVYFAKPGSVNSFANAMHRALSNLPKAKEVGANGRKTAETHFNKDVQTQILYEFLKNTF